MSGYSNVRTRSGLIHPHLRGRDLLRKQLDACRAAEIRAAVYLTVQFDDKVAYGLGGFAERTMNNTVNSMGIHWLN